jgi:hypothetical protein
MAFILLRSPCRSWCFTPCAKYSHRRSWPFHCAEFVEPSASSHFHHRFHCGWVSGSSSNLFVRDPWRMMKQILCTRLDRNSETLKMHNNIIMIGASSLPGEIMLCTGMYLQTSQLFTVARAREQKILDNAKSNDIDPPATLLDSKKY